MFKFTKPKSRITITRKNLNQWPKYENLLNDGKLVLDKRNRLRYLHGAPVGVMILSKTEKNGSPVYRESAEEWFDPDSPKAKSFKWPL